MADSNSIGKCHIIDTELSASKYYYFLEVCSIKLNSLRKFHFFHTIFKYFLS